MLWWWICSSSDSITIQSGSLLVPCIQTKVRPPSGLKVWMVCDCSSPKIASTLPFFLSLQLKTTLFSKILINEKKNHVMNNYTRHHLPNQWFSKLGNCTKKIENHCTKCLSVLTSHLPRWWYSCSCIPYVFCLVFRVAKILLDSLSFLILYSRNMCT